jgi:hypothetical protein
MLLAHSSTPCRLMLAALSSSRRASPRRRGAKARPTLQAPAAPDVRRLASIAATSLWRRDPSSNVASVEALASVARERPAPMLAAEL